MSPASKSLGDRQEVRELAPFMVNDGGQGVPSGGASLKPCFSDLHRIRQNLRSEGPRLPDRTVRNNEPSAHPTTAVTAVLTGSGAATRESSNKWWKMQDRRKKTTKGGATRASRVWDVAIPEDGLLWEMNVFLFGQPLDFNKWRLYGSPVGLVSGMHSRVEVPNGPHSPGDGLHPRWQGGRHGYLYK